MGLESVLESFPQALFPSTHPPPVCSAAGEEGKVCTVGVEMIRKEGTFTNSLVGMQLGEEKLG